MTEDQQRSRRWRQWSALGVLAATTLLYLWPNLTYYAAHGTRFFPATSFDEDYYAALAVSTAVGRGLTINPLLGRASPSAALGTEALQFAPRLVTAGLVRVFGLGLAFGIISLVVPILVFLLVYRLSLSLARSHLWALASACGLLLLPFYLPPLHATANWILHLGFGHSSAEAPFLGGVRYTRRYNPALSAIVFYAFLLAHWRAMERRSVRWAIAAGLLGGSLFYCYVFFALSGLMSACLWTAFTLIYFRESVRVAVAGIAVQLALAGPFFYFLLSGMRSLQSGFAIPSRTPWWPWTDVLAVLLPLAVLFYFRGLTRTPVWLLTVCIAPILCMNAQVLTRMSVEPWHYNAYVGLPLGIFLFCVVCGNLLPPARHTHRVAGMAMVLLALAAGIFAQRRTADFVKQSLPETAPDRLRPVFDQIRQRAGMEDVILAGDDVASGPWLVAATGRPVFDSFYIASFPPADPTEYRRRALCYYYLDGDDEKAFLAGPANEARSLLYAPEGFRYWFYSNLWTDEVKRERAGEFGECLRNPAGCCLPQYRADWLIESKNKPLDRVRLDEFYDVEPVFADDRFSLSRLARKNR